MRRFRALRPFAPIFVLLVGSSILPAIGLGCGGGNTDATSVTNSDDAMKKKMDKIEQIKKERFEEARKKASSGKP